jgi:signal transduction histidine kinase
MSVLTLKAIYRRHCGEERSITGSGLDLYIVKETLKGNITINSKKGEGKNIRIMIPGIIHATIPD